MSPSSPTPHSLTPHGGASLDHAHPDPHPLAHTHSHSHSHSHGPGLRHPAARPSLSLLRLSAWQRLAIVIPLAVLLWAAALWVMHGAGN